jgi:ketosteroid isomerase-like protein
MIDTHFAERFAHEWIAAWNRHDLEAVLSHYSNDFEMSSPYIARIARQPSGTLKGKEAVRSYWAAALEVIPDLHFDLAQTLVGVNSITLYYRGARGMAAEVFHFDADGIVVRASAHYA